MNDLIERLEKAEEGDTALDVAIIDALDLAQTVPLAERQWWYRQEPDGSQTMKDYAPYTTSIDAALTLVPEGWGCIVWNFAEGDNGDATEVRACRCEVHPLSPDSEAPSIGWEANTVPLAICIAALKARDKEREDD